MSNLPWEKKILDIIIPFRSHAMGSPSTICLPRSGLCLLMGLVSKWSQMTRSGQGCEEKGHVSLLSQNT